MLFAGAAGGGVDALSDSDLSRNSSLSQCENTPQTSASVPVPPPRSKKLRRQSCFAAITNSGTVTYVYPARSRFILVLGYYTASAASAHRLELVVYVLVSARPTTRSGVIAFVYGTDQLPTMRPMRTM